MHGGDPKIHIYTNEYGVGTGAALIQYENEHSVTDAIKMYNGEYLIIGCLTMKIFIQILIR
jgi:hypothetical protein